jgi:hypothetical protein
MKVRSVLSLLLCLSLIFLCFGFNKVVIANHDSNNDSGPNAIIASDSGGGNIGPFELAAIVIIAIAVVIIVALVVIF